MSSPLSRLPLLLLLLLLHKEGGGTPCRSMINRACSPSTFPFACRPLLARAESLASDCAAMHELSLTLLRDAPSRVAGIILVRMLKMHEMPRLLLGIPVTRFLEHSLPIVVAPFACP